MENWQRVTGAFAGPLDTRYFSRPYEGDGRPGHLHDTADRSLVDIQAFPEEIRQDPYFARWLEEVRNYHASMERLEQQGIEPADSQEPADLLSRWEFEIPERKIAQLWFGPRVEEASGQVFRLHRSDEQGAEIEQEVRLLLRLPDDAVFDSQGVGWIVSLDARGVDPADDLQELELSVEELDQLMQQLDGGTLL